MKQIIYICLGLLLLFTSNTPIVAQEVSDYTQLSEEDYSNITLPPLSVLFENAKDNPIYEMADVKAAVERKLLAKEYVLRKKNVHFSDSSVCGEATNTVLSAMNPPIQTFT